MVKIEKAPATSGLKGSSTGLLPSKSGSTQNMAANIKVVVRVRPLNEKEGQQNSRIIVDVVDDRMLVFDPKEEIRPFYYQGVQQPNKNFLKRANKELKFVFDHVCSQEASNKDVFETTTKDMLSSLMEGYNCSVFVYGATGAGKTFTMIGNIDNPGITYLTMDHLFYTINSFKAERDFDIGVSYIEVYNENVFDLLKPSKTPLQLREDSKYGVMVAGLTLNNIKTARELLNMLENGNKNRTQHPTDANAESSRSHAVFQVYVTMRYKTSSQLRVVKLSMIDLAGSERASATGCVGERFKEGANINRSLLSLGNCINKLADGSAYIPYRDSKLTRLLKDSLGGNCKTVMIANVSPSSFSYEDTYNTLKYAARANKIQLSIKKNIIDGDMRLSQYVKITEELKKKVKELEAKLSLSNLKPVQTQSDPGENECRHRLLEAEAVLEKMETELLGLITRQRVLCHRQRQRTRAISHVGHLVHRSSNETMDQMCTEELPRKERAAESCVKQSILLTSKISTLRAKWMTLNNEIRVLCEQAVTSYPRLKDLVDNIHVRSELRLSKANEDLKYKLFSIDNKEVETVTEHKGEMLNLLKKIYLTLKGYDKTTPALTDEYMNVMKQAISENGISWSDKECGSDVYSKSISTIDLEKPTALDFIVKDEVNASVEIVTDSDDLTDLENREPSVSKKRKGTPIKLRNNETIIINDSLEVLDVNAFNSAKKVKVEHDAADVENYGVLDANDMNSTFVMPKMGPLKKQYTEPANVEENQPLKRGLADRTNTVQRSISFNDKGRNMDSPDAEEDGSTLPLASGRREKEHPGGQHSKIVLFTLVKLLLHDGARLVKPVVGKAVPLRRGVPAAPAACARGPGFGSSLARDGTPLQRNIQATKGRPNVYDTQRSVGFKAVRARERVQTHPYSRPGLGCARK